MYDRIFGTVNNGEVEFVPYKPEFFEGVKEVLYNDYFIGECLANGFGINLPENASLRDDIANIFCLPALADGLSIVARDVRTQKIVGHAVNQLYIKDTSGEPSPLELYKAHKCTSANTTAFMSLMVDLEKRVDMFALRQTDVLLDVMFVGVSRAYARRSIGLKLIEYTLQLGREVKGGHCLERLPVEQRPMVCRLGGAIAIFTSNYSKAIGDRLGFETHEEIFYEQIERNGKTLQHWIPDPLQRSMTLSSVAL